MEHFSICLRLSYFQLCANSLSFSTYKSHLLNMLQLFCRILRMECINLSRLVGKCLRLDIMLPLQDRIELFVLSQ